MDRANEAFEKLEHWLWDNAPSIPKEITDAKNIIRQALTQTARGDDWQDISTAPKDGKEILISDGLYVEIGLWDYGWCVRNNGDYYDGGYGRNYETKHEWSDYKPPTHWQPLPEPPARYSLVKKEGV